MIKGAVMKKKTAKRVKSNSPVFEVIVFVVLAIYTLSMIALFLWAFNFSLKDSDKNLYINTFAIATDLKFSNYVTAFNALKVSTGLYDVYLDGLLVNSFVYSAGCALMTVAATAIVAYCTARYDCRLSRFVHDMVIVLIVLPIVGNLAAQVQMTNVLKIYDTLIGSYSMKFSFINMYYLVLYASFKVLPKDYAESAFIDGASEFRVFWSIMLPLVSTMLGAVFLLYFISYWNDYQVPMVFLPSMPTAALALANYTSGKGIEAAAAGISVQIAGGVLVFIPVFAVFLVFRKKLMGNLTEGGIKE